MIEKIKDHTKSCVDTQGEAKEEEIGEGSLRWNEPLSDSIIHPFLCAMSLRFCQGA